MINLENLTTERRNETTFGLDEMSVAEAVQLMNQEDHNVPDAVAEQLPQIEKVIEAKMTWLSESLPAAGHLMSSAD